MYWSDLNSTSRLRPSLVKKSEADLRSAYEGDYDRVLFSSAFRRLQDKTQVFPLDRNDFVRTRLTHSLEVSTVGRDMGSSVAKVLERQGIDRNLNPEDAGTLVATACLLHDIGNPPFGHSGEQSIGQWFKSRFDNGKLKIEDRQERLDLEKFEGNASGFRIATRLQHLGQSYGMNLTAGALACLMKYPCGSHEVNWHIKAKERPKKCSKFGYFKADAVTFRRVQTLTKLSGITRHPLTFLMEAADDIVYSAVDLEDALKKGTRRAWSWSGSICRIDAKN